MVKTRVSSYTSIALWGQLWCEFRNLGYVACSVGTYWAYEVCSTIIFLWRELGESVMVGEGGRGLVDPPFPPNYCMF